jgi:hypothetical protein
MCDMAMTKGTGPKDAEYAKGGPSIGSRSRFMKQPDPFRTDIERTDYSGKKDPLADPQGDSKSLKPIKPRT